MRFGIQFMADKHLAEIESEFCLAEGGSLNRQGGKVTFASIQTLEKIPARHHADRPGHGRPRLGAAALATPS